MAKERMYRDFMVELRGFDETTGTYEVALPPTPEYGEPDPVSASLDRIFPTHFEERRAICEG
jgi:hypothetical protein